MRDDKKYRELVCCRQELSVDHLVGVLTGLIADVETGSTVSKAITGRRLKVVSLTLIRRLIETVADRENAALWTRWLVAGRPVDFASFDGSMRRLVVELASFTRAVSALGDDFDLEDVGWRRVRTSFVEILALVGQQR